MPHPTRLRSQRRRERRRRRRKRQSRIQMSVKWGGRVWGAWRRGWGAPCASTRSTPLYQYGLGGEWETKVTVDVLKKDQSKQNVPNGCFKKKKFFLKEHTKQCAFRGQLPSKEFFLSFFTFLFGIYYFYTLTICCDQQKEAIFLHPTCPALTYYTDWMLKINYVHTCTLQCSMCHFSI